MYISIEERIEELEVELNRLKRCVNKWREADKPMEVVK